MRKNYITTICLLLSILSVQVSWALPDDGDQPIDIEADHATYKVEDGQEISTYTGSVVMTQGSMKLSGDEVIIYSDQQVVSMLQAKGNPAHFQQQPQPGEALIQAYADYIEYNVSLDTIVLLENARTEQAGSTIIADRIDYNVVDGTMEASGIGSIPSRVQVLLIPDKGDDAPATDTATPEQATAAVWSAPNGDSSATEPAAPKDSWALQVASLSSEAVAKDWQQTLQQRGYNSYLDIANNNNEPSFIVYVGPYTSRAQAVKDQQQIDTAFGVQSSVQRVTPNQHGK